MWSLLDNLSALIVLPAVALVAAGLYLANGQSQVESASQEVSVGALHEVADWIERDLANVGSGVSSRAPIILGYEWEATGRGALTFVSGVDTSVVAPPDTVRYERRLTAPGRYELLRYVVESGTERLDARSPAWLQTLELHLLRSDGSVVPPHGDPTAAAAVAVRLALPPAYAEGRPAVWSQTFPFRRSTTR